MFPFVFFDKVLFQFFLLNKTEHKRHCFFTANKQKTHAEKPQNRFLVVVAVAKAIVFGEWVVTQKLRMGKEEEQKKEEKLIFLLCIRL